MVLQQVSAQRHDQSEVKVALHAMFLCMLPVMYMCFVHNVNSTNFVAV